MPGTQSRQMQKLAECVIWMDQEHLIGSQWLKQTHLAACLSNKFTVFPSQYAETMLHKHTQTIVFLVLNSTSEMHPSIVHSKTFKTLVAFVVTTWQWVENCNLLLIWIPRYFTRLVHRYNIIFSKVNWTLLFGYK